MRSHKSAAMRHTMINLFLLVLICVMYFTLCLPQSTPTMGTTVYYRANREGRFVSLQCIVRWNSSVMTEILDIVGKRSASITFFVTRDWATQNAELLKRMVKEGHEIGVTCLDANDYEGEIKAALDAVKQVCDYEVRLFCCNTDDIGKSAAAAKKNSLTSVRCTESLLCGRGTVSDIVTRAQSALKAGSIVNSTPTVAFRDALPSLLDMCEGKGLLIVSTSYIIGVDSA